MPLRVRNSPSDVARACKAAHMELVPFDPGALHPDTAPVAIAAAQRAAVEEAVSAAGPGASPRDVSLVAVLPASVVERRCRELGIVLAGMAPPVAPPSQ